MTCFKTDVVGHEYEVMKAFYLQTNGTDTTTKKSASLTGEAEYAKASGAFLCTSMSVCSAAVTCTLGSLSPKRSVYKNSLCPTEKGIKLVQEGLYAQAASMFTEAIKCDPKDYRCVFYGHD